LITELNICLRRGEWYSNKDYAFADVTINGAEANLIFRDPGWKVLNSFVIPKKLDKGLVRKIPLKTYHRRRELRGEN